MIVTYYDYNVVQSYSCRKYDIVMTLTPPLYDDHNSEDWCQKTVPLLKRYMSLKTFPVCLCFPSDFLFKPCPPHSWPGGSPRMRGGLWLLAPACLGCTRPSYRDLFGHFVGLHLPWTLSFDFSSLLARFSIPTGLPEPFQIHQNSK